MPRPIQVAAIIPTPSLSATEYLTDPTNRLNSSDALLASTAGFFVSTVRNLDHRFRSSSND
jgi:hypothetical protein